MKAGDKIKVLKAKPSYLVRHIGKNGTVVDIIPKDDTIQGVKTLAIVKMDGDTGTKAFGLDELEQIPNG